MREDISEEAFEKALEEGIREPSPKQDSPPSDAAMRVAEQLCRVDGKALSVPVGRWLSEVFIASALDAFAAEQAKCIIIGCDEEADLCMACAVARETRAYDDYNKLRAERDALTAELLAQRENEHAVFGDLLKTRDERDRYLAALKAEAIGGMDQDGKVPFDWEIGGITFRVTRAPDGELTAEEVVE
jgi:hypothetical protein